MSSVAAVLQPDVTLYLEMDGVIREVAFSNTLAGESRQAWIGRRWSETVNGPGAAKVERLVEDAREHRVSAFRQVPQRFPSGIELLMEYTAVRLGPRAGLVAVGKNLQAVAALQSSVVAAQQALERDYWRLRNIESRYRLLFNASAEASVMVEASSLKILEANSAALDVLRPGDERLEGREISAQLAIEDREKLLAMLHRVREHGSAPGVLVHLAREHAPITVRASLLKAEPSAVFLLQLSAVGQWPRAVAEREPPLTAEGMLERHPYGFALVRADGTIVRANKALIELLQIGAGTWVAGEKLGRWLEGGDAALAGTLSRARERGASEVATATVLGELGRRAEVELTAATTAGDTPQIGVLVRPLGVEARFGRESLESSLAETARWVERQCIEKALELRGGDEGAAAEVLGLTKRSLRLRLERLRGVPAV